MAFIVISVNGPALNFFLFIEQMSGDSARKALQLPDANFWFDLGILSGWPGPDIQRRDSFDWHQ